MTNSPHDRPDRHPLLEARGVWKVFGPHGERIVDSPDADLSRGELHEKSGNTVAVRDVTLDIWPGEVFVVMGAKAIAGDNVDPEKAGKDWVEQNQDKVQSWLGGT